MLPERSRRGSSSREVGAVVPANLALGVEGDREAPGLVVVERPVPAEDVHHGEPRLHHRGPPNGDRDRREVLGERRGLDRERQERRLAASRVADRDLHGVAPAGAQAEHGQLVLEARLLVRGDRLAMLAVVDGERGHDRAIGREGENAGERHSRVGIRAQCHVRGDRRAGAGGEQEHSRCEQRGCCGDGSGVEGSGHEGSDHEEAVLLSRSCGVSVRHPRMGVTCSRAPRGPERRSDRWACAR